ncbi:hypothetical protein [Mucilaginibacter aquaedulcis]|uniref:hypothetical protein n=1 Tax=Mucilaginibacter aquaedulcis TaxID=1187081 RepID=UPI0025B41A8F|nr:hypothetical protein [Mucilaginibacter aquaedulcis]MDN3547168.1 hypothetical protein [Mucilaginibacter aquaedulcis]
MRQLVRFLTLLVILFCAQLKQQVKADTYDWLGAVDNDVTKPANWVKLNLTSCTITAPGPGDDVRFGVISQYVPYIINIGVVCVALLQTSVPYTYSPIITTAQSVTWNSVTMGPLRVNNTITVNGALTVTNDLTLAINNTTGSTNPNGLNFLRGTGSITCNNIQIGGGTTVVTTNDYLLSYVKTLKVLTNVNVIINTSANNGSGFRLEDGDMSVYGKINISNPNNVAVVSGSKANFGYFTINGTTSTGTTVKTNPSLSLYDANALVFPTATGVATMNFNGNRQGALAGGSINIYYKGIGAQTIYTTSTPGFGSANFGTGIINTTVPTYDNLYIQNGGVATIGASTGGILLVDSLFRTSGTTTFATNTTTTTIGTAGTIAGTWLNDAGITVTGGAGTFDINGTLTNNGIMTMGTGALNIAVNYTNTGTFTANPTPTITFDGTTQSLTDATTAGTNFYNVTFTGGGTKTMNTGSKFTVAPTYTLNVLSSSTLAVGSSASTTALTMLSTAAGDASIGGLAAGTITGNINVQRFILGGLRRYMLLSAPVSTSSAYTLAQFIPDTWMTGPGGATPGAGFDSSPSTNNSPSVFMYDENAPATVNPNLVLNNEYRPFATTNETVPLGNGFLFYFRGKRVAAVNPFVAPFPTAQDATLTFFGAVFNPGATGTLTPKVINFPAPPAPATYTSMAGGTNLSYASTDANKKGFNLIGNPYASTIDLNKFYNVNTTKYQYYYQLVRNTATGTNSSSTRFAVFDALSTSVPPTGASRFILSGQGFFIRAASASSFTFNESMKVTYNFYTTVTSPTSPKSPVFSIKKPGSVLAKSTLSNGTTQAAANINETAAQSIEEDTPAANSTPVASLRLELSRDSNVLNSTDINFTKNKDSKFKIEEDAQFIQPSGQGDLFYSITSDSVSCFVNYTNDLEKIKRINLGVNFSNYGLYKITSPIKQNIDERYTIFLKDKFTGDSLDVVHNSTYSFNVTTTPASYAHDRFYLNIGIAPGHEYKLRSFTGSKVTTGLQLNWLTDNESTFTKFIIQKSINNGTSFTAIDSVQSSAKGEYTFIDHTPGNGDVTYRLAQVLVNGTTQLSKSLAFNFDGSNNSNAANFMVYPTNAYREININLGKTYNNNVKVNIVSSNGSMVKTLTSNGTNLLEQNVSGLLKGLYVVEAIDVITGKRIGSAKFYKQ